MSRRIKSAGPAGALVSHETSDGGLVGYSIALDDRGRTLWVGEISDHLFVEHGLDEHFEHAGGWWAVDFGLSPAETVVICSAIPDDRERALRLINLLYAGLRINLLYAGLRVALDALAVSAALYVVAAAWLATC